jgi:hypothetical protein
MRAPVPPEADGLVAYVDATLRQEIHDIAQRQRVSHVHHHDRTDDLLRAVKISERVAHSVRLPRPAIVRLCSDTAQERAILLWKNLTHGYHLWPPRRAAQGPDDPFADLSALEDQMVAMTTSGFAGNGSPGWMGADRIDGDAAARKPRMDGSRKSFEARRGAAATRLRHFALSLALERPLGRSNSVRIVSLDFRPYG